MRARRQSFHFQSCVGLAGFGELYLAEARDSNGLERRVAVKVLKESLRDAPEAVERIRDEGRMLAVLDHPCILRVIEQTFIQGRVALVTEYLPGIDLGRCCKPSTLLPPRVVMEVIGEVASALHCAFTTLSPETGKPLQLIHRDIKPANIRIGESGEVKVLDFGIARTTEMFRHAKTAQGQLPFTPAYAPPEAFTKGFQGGASDVFALGVTLYRLLTGQRFHEMQLSEQVGVYCLDDRYEPFLAERLTHIQDDRFRSLITHMLAYSPRTRPAAVEVEATCKALAEVLDGPTLKRWATAQTFPEPKSLDDGSLTGQTLEEDQLEPEKISNPRESYRSRKGSPMAELQVPDRPSPTSSFATPLPAAQVQKRPSDSLSPPPRKPSLPPEPTSAPMTLGGNASSGTDITTLMVLGCSALAIVTGLGLVGLGVLIVIASSL